MVLVRCDDHFPENGGRGRNYVVAVEPVGFPESGAVCGRKGHTEGEPGYALLDETELELFEQGQRAFEPHTNAVHVQVKDNIVAEL